MSIPATVTTKLIAYLLIGANARVRRLRQAVIAEREAQAAARREADAAEVWRHLEGYDDPQGLVEFFTHFEGTAAYAAARAQGLSAVRVGVKPSAETRVLKPGDTFQDLEAGPHMVVVPPGNFLMGSPDGEGRDDEHPQHEVTIAEPFAVSIAPITRGQYAAFIAETKRDMSGGAYVWTGSKFKHRDDGSWKNPGFEQDDDHPVVCVNWHDAHAYAAWLQSTTGHASYRLLSEAEWEYCCRAGTTTKYASGDEITKQHAHFSELELGDAGGTVAVRSFLPNAWGLHDMHGNVVEWVEDHWHANYQDASDDGSAWAGGDENRRVLRGGAWFIQPDYLRSAYRDRAPPVNRYGYAGFRVARTLTP